jgi:hypothetical protein
MVGAGQRHWLKGGAAMAIDEAVYVAIVPPDILETNLISEVAAIINKDLYGTRLLLTGKAPKIIARHDAVQTAELAARSLKALGLVAFVCQDSTLRKSSQCFRAHTMKFGQEEVLFRDESGESMTMESRNTFLILEGKRQTHTETETTKTRRKLNLAATVLTGGLPVWSEVKEKTVNTLVQTDYFVRLYERKSLEPSVEILRYHLDYSFLEAEMAPLSLTNFNTVVKKIRAVFPEAVFDDRLTGNFGLEKPLRPRDRSIGPIGVRLRCSHRSDRLGRRPAKSFRFLCGRNGGRNSAVEGNDPPRG